MERVWLAASLTSYMSLAEGGRGAEGVGEEGRWVRVGMGYMWSGTEGLWTNWVGKENGI